MVESVSNSAYVSETEFKCRCLHCGNTFSAFAYVLRGSQCRLIGAEVSKLLSSFLSSADDKFTVLGSVNL